MLDFYTPTIEDAKWIVPLVEKSGQIGCDLSFATTYLWRKEYDIRVCCYNNTYYKAYFNNGIVAGYTYPVGNDISKQSIDVIIDDAKSRGVTPVIGMLNQTNAEILTLLYPDMFDITPDRDSADYIYSGQNLAQLSGKKYHAKRNHISKFVRNYPDYCYKNLDDSIADDAYAVAQKWQSRYGGDNHAEISVIKQALEKLKELSLFGGVLYVDQKPVAMTIASKINDKVCDVNFEKAVDIRESYAVINNEFAKSHPEFLQINREEDMGIASLRKSKLSYNPDILLMKYTAVLKS